jgi:hypothetical protein
VAGHGDEDTFRVRGDEHYLGHGRVPWGVLPR